MPEVIEADWKKLEEPLNRLIYHTGDAYSKMFLPTVCFDCEKAKKSLIEAKKILLEEMVI